MRTLALLLHMLENPGMGLVQGLAHERQIVATKNGGFFPKITVSVEANDRDVVSIPGFRFVKPDPSLDQAVPDLVNWLAHDFS
jgi:hypothetical protein